MRLPPTPLRRLLLPVQVAVVLILPVAFAAATMAAAVAAPFGRRRRPLRICAFGMAYCTIELAVIGRAGLLWLRQPRVGPYNRGAERSGGGATRSSWAGPGVASWGPSVSAEGGRPPERRY
jgi:hypothetical protein